jgi:YesN/AraC family two-component response regulator
VANSLAAVENGAEQVECTINGIGERAGNASLEEIVMALRVKNDLFGIDTGIDTTQIYTASRLVSQVTGIKVQPNKAIVGDNAFAHEAGIHQHGVMANRETYEIMKPESIGITKNRMVLGKHSGRHAFGEYLKEMGFSVDAETLKKLFADISNTHFSYTTKSTMERVVQYIEANYAQELKLEMLAGIFGYNSAYLGKVFHQHTGENFNNYLDRIRITEAKRLLSLGEHKVYEVAEMVGYSNINYFHNKFKKHVQVSPLNYKRSGATAEKEKD